MMSPRALGAHSGVFKGRLFSTDSDLYKWMEGASFGLAYRDDPALRKKVDDVTQLIGEAQLDDGYINTYFQIGGIEKRWTDLEKHEMYCIGHLIQAAIAHHRATGSDKFLAIARRAADHIDSMFGPGKREACPAHPEIEMELVELFRETCEKHYLALARVLLGNRNVTVNGENIESPAALGPAARPDDYLEIRRNYAEGDVTHLSPLRPVRYTPFAASRLDSLPPSAIIPIQTSGHIPGGCMNHHLTYEHVASRLSENDLAYETVDIGGGVRIIVSQKGGRVFGPFAGESSESVLWLNEPFKETDSFKRFLDSGDWNLGGNRVWIAPEHRFNMKDRFNLFETYTLPADIDPGRYELTSNANGFALTVDAVLAVYGPEASAKELRVERSIVPAADPLRETTTYGDLAQNVSYGGFLHEVRLAEAKDDGVPAELWDLAQVNIGGHAYAAVSNGETRTDFYKPSDEAHYTVFPNYTRLKIDGEYMYKVGYKAPQFLGRIAYHNSLGNGTEYLLVRAFLSNPSATYTMEPPEVPGDRGYPIQVFNDDGTYGGFGEIECSGQAIGGDTGRSETIDQIVNWLYVGPRESLKAIARILIGAELE